MASRNSKQTGAIRKHSHYKNKFSQDEVLKKLKDLFEDILDRRVIESVARGCNYDLTCSINTLLEKSENCNKIPSTVTKKSNGKKYQKNTTEKKKTEKNDRNESDLAISIDNINKGYKVLILLRGLPGSGKSTLAKKIYDMTVSNIEGAKPEFHIYSTDDYFVWVGKGNYCFNPMLLSEAHSWNQKRVYNGMVQGISPILVDNTNIMGWEMRPYAIGAVQNGYSISILEPTTPWSFNEHELANRCIHNVPKTSIREMINRYERNITSNSILKMFSLQYSVHNQPPQRRVFPLVKDFLKTDKEKKKQANCIDKAGMNKYIKINENTQRLVESKNEVKEETGEKSDESEREFLNTERSILKISQIKVDKVFGDSDENNVQSDSDINNVKQQPLVTFLKVNVNPNSIDLCSQNVDNSFTSDHNSSYLSAANKQTENNVNKCQAFTLIMDNGDLINSTDSFENDEHSAITMRNVEQLSQISDFESNGTVDNSSIIRYTHEDLLNVLDESNRATVDYILKYSTAPKPERAKKKRTKNISAEIEQEENKKSEDVHDLINLDVLPEESWENSHSQMLVTGLENRLSTFYSFLNENSNQKKVSLIDSPLVNSENNSCFIQPLIQIGTNTLQETMPFEKLSEKCSLPKEDVSEDILSVQIDKEMFTYVDNNLINLDNQIITDAKNIESSFELPKSDAYNCDQTNFNSSDANQNKSSNGIKSDSSLSVNKDSDTGILNKTSEPNKKNNLSIRDFFKFSFFNTSDKNKLSSNAAKETILKNETEEIRNYKTDKNEMSTNTTDNDFKLLKSVATKSQLEGISLLRACSRNINEFNTFDTHTKMNPPKVFMLDKSSMTENEDLLDSQSDEQTKKDFITLVELFPDFPEDNLKDIFDKCKKNLRWTVDLLLDSKHVIFSDKSGESSEIRNDVAIKNNNEESENTNNSESENTKFHVLCEPYIEEKIHFTDQQDSEENSSFQLNNIIVKKKSKKSQVPSELSLELKKQLEEQFVIRDEFYSEHCLKIKKLRHGIAEPDVDVVNKVQFSRETKRDEYDDSTETESVEEEEDESIELDLGINFINQLESNFGNAFKDSKFFESLQPVIQLPVSIARQLHAFWLESVIEQLCVYEQQLEQMVKEDQEFAQRLQEKENEMLNTGKEPIVSNLQEILDMEIALALAKSDKKHSSEENFEEISLKLTLEKLYELFPDLDKDDIYHIFQAYDNKFDQTVDVLSFNTKHMLNENNVVYGFSKEDILKQEQKLLIKVKEANLQNTESKQIKQTIIVTNSPTNKSDQKSKMELAEYYRTEAQYQLILRDRCIQKAQAAYNKGLTQVALYYSEVASLHKQNFEQANALAASSFLSAHAQANCNSMVLDLHYLFKAEALEALDLFLDKHISLLVSKQKKYEFLYIITGKGSRSNNGQPIIKPAVIKRLKQRNLRFIPVNSGFLRVKIRPHDVMTCNVPD